MKRKNYSKELKIRVALVAIKGNQTVNEIASEFGVHVMGAGVKLQESFLLLV